MYTLGGVRTLGGAYWGDSLGEGIADDHFSNTYYVVVSALHEGVNLSQGGDRETVFLFF